MAERRMFSLSVTDSDEFQQMPISTQCLYFHLAMHADDDGFVNSPRRIQRTIGAGDDDFKVLISKSFIIPFQSGVCVIRHWRVHNCIRKDRYKPSRCEEANEIACLQNGEYVQQNKIGIPSDNQVATICQPSGCIGKVRLGKERIGEVGNRSFISDDEADELAGNAQQLNAVFDAAERAGFPHTQADLDRLNLIVADYTPDAVINAIGKAVDQGTEKRTWAYLRGILKSDPTGGECKKTPEIDRKAMLDERTRKALRGEYD